MALDCWVHLAQAQYCQSGLWVFSDQTAAMERVNLESPRWDQSTYMGRARHFITVTNPLNVFATSAELDAAKDVVSRYRWGPCRSGGTRTPSDRWTRAGPGAVSQNLVLCRVSEWKIQSPKSWSE